MNWRLAAIGAVLMALILAAVPIWHRLRAPVIRSLPADLVDAPPNSLPAYFLLGDSRRGTARMMPAYRPEGARTPTHALSLLLEGPSAREQEHGFWTAMPEGAALLGIRRSNGETVVDLTDLGDAEHVPLAAAQVAATLAAFPEIRAVRVCVQGRAVRAILRAQFLNPVFPAPRPTATAVPFGEPLAGKVIVVNPGHGLTRLSNGGWLFQRPYYGGAVEDRVNMWFAHHAMRELRRLGATVHSTRAEALDEERGTSGRPLWEEASKYYLQSIGMPEWVHQPLPAELDADIDCRPLYANYRRADLLISLHNNIGRASGTLTLYDTSNGFRAESGRLASLLQRHVVGAIRAEIAPSWRSMGAVGSSARYGENHWAHMPSALLEVGFISQRRDRRLITTDAFQEVVGRAVAAAVVEYFAAPQEAR